MYGGSSLGMAPRTHSLSTDRAWEDLRREVSGARAATRLTMARAAAPHTCRACLCMPRGTLSGTLLSRQRPVHSAAWRWVDAASHSPDAGLRAQKTSLRQARRLEGELEVKLQALTKLSSGLEGSYRSGGLRQEHGSGLGPDQVGGARRPRVAGGANGAACKAASGGCTDPTHRLCSDRRVQELAI